MDSEAHDVSLQKKEDINRAFPHLRLSNKNWSDSSVGCT
jgi:hypothetical protein